MDKYDEYKLQIVKVCRRLCEEGYFGAKTGSGGNISMLVEGEDAIVVTPSSMKYDEITIDDVCVVDLDKKRIEGTRDPSVETPMHIAVYKNRKDVNAVIHSHPPFASVFAVLNKPIPPLFDEVAISIGNKIEVVPYALSGTPDLLNNVVGKLSNRCQCYILQNHGALCVGKNMEKTVLYLELLEKVAAIYYRALATGEPVTELPEMFSTALFSFVTSAQDVEIARKENLKRIE